MSKKSKHEQKQYEYEMGPGGGKRKKSGKKTQASSNGSTGLSKSFMIGLMVLMMIAVFFNANKISNGLVKNADFTVSSYAVVNGEIAQQPDATVHYDADSEEAVTLRKILRSNAYRTHNTLGTLTTSPWDTEGASRMIQVQTGDEKLDFKVLDNGNVLANGSKVKMGYFDNKMALSYINDVTALMNGTINS